MADTKNRPVTEEITVDRAIELLHLHKTGTSPVKSPVVSVVRDPHDRNRIISIALNETASGSPK